MKTTRSISIAAALLAALLAPASAPASSHMDAPLVTFDDAANTTDVYAFVSEQGGDKFLTTAVAVYPFEEPGVGPNRYNFDDNVQYEINVAMGDDLPAGRATLLYRFRFLTRHQNPSTIRQSYLGIIADVGDANQNLVQTYSIEKVDNRIRKKKDRVTVLGTGLLVPPNNQGLATPRYNVDDDGEQPARDGVAVAGDLDAYTQQTVYTLPLGYQAFAGQRDDGFFADIQAVFDLLQLRSPGKDTQKGFNVHTISLNIPVDELGGDDQIVGIWASTSRPKITIPPNPVKAPKVGKKFVQVGRQGNPLFNEGFVAVRDKDTYGRSTPEDDRELFVNYALNPEIADLLGVAPPLQTDRTDIAGIYIPDVIKVDLSTGAVPLAGGGPNHPTNPDDPGFHRLSLFGGDTIFSPLQNQEIPSGWPNGRRFGDDVLDIAVTAAISDLRLATPVINHGGDAVDANDAVYNKVFPYAAPPHNGRRHLHDDETPTTPPGGACESCLQTLGFGGVPAVTVGFSVQGTAGEAFSLQPGAPYFLGATAFREQTVATDPLVDVAIEVRLDDQVIGTATFPTLDLFGAFPPITFIVPEDIGEIGCLTFVVDGVVDQQFPFPIDAS